MSPVYTVVTIQGDPIAENVPHPLPNWGDVIEVDDAFAQGRWKVVHVEHKVRRGELGVRVDYLVVVDLEVPPEARG